MTKTLESLSAFQAKSINKDAMSKIYGGTNAPAGTETGSGTTCVPTSTSASGCLSYSSDYIHENGNAAYSPSNGTIANSDVNGD